MPSQFHAVLIVFGDEIERTAVMLDPRFGRDVRLKSTLYNVACPATHESGFCEKSEDPVSSFDKPTVTDEVARRWHGLMHDDVPWDVVPKVDLDVPQPTLQGTGRVAPDTRLRPLRQERQRGYDLVEKLGLRG